MASNYCESFENVPVHEREKLIKDLIHLIQFDEMISRRMIVMVEVAVELDKLKGIKHISEQELYEQEQKAKTDLYPE